MGVKVVFIIGQHRTGSTLLKNVLNAHSEVSMAFDEMNLFEPFRKNTLDSFLDSGDITPGQLKELIIKKKIYGTFWQEFEKSGINVEEFCQELEQKVSLTPVSVIGTILNLLRKKNRTTIVGVKYPLHFSRVDYLLEHFSDSAVLFLTRNPKAIISSKLNDEATKQRKGKSIVHRFLIHYFTLFYFSIEYIFSVKMYLKNKDHLILVTYENLVANMNETVQQLCTSLNIRFEKSMLQASGKSSSYTIDSTNGIHAQSIQKYKQRLSVFDIRLIDLLTKRYYNKIKHESGSDI